LLGFPVISHAANHLPNSLIIQAERNYVLRYQKVEMQLQKKQD